MSALPTHGSSHDGTSSDDDTSTSCVDVTSSPEETKTELKRSGLGEKETQKLRSLKFFGLFVLLFSVGGALAVYFYLVSSETKTFEKQFVDDGTKVLASLGAAVYFTIGALDGLVVNLVSYAKSTNQPWPYVTIPDFYIRAGKVIRATNAHCLNTYAYVTAHEREEWQNYTSTHNSWVQEGFNIQARDSSYTGPIVMDNLTWDVIHDYSEWEKPEEEQGKVGTDRPGPYLPWWQSVPIIPGGYTVYNW
jgi:hypothetical protein